MIYVLYGENESAINKYIKKLTIDNNIDTTVTYIYKECTIESVIEEAGYLDLFGNKKIVILNDAEFLTAKSTLENKTLDNYISNPNENTILIFKIITEKLDERKKLVKTLKKYAKVIEFKLPSENELDKYIQSYFNERNYTIDKPALNEIINRLKSNTKVLDKELEKLEIYKIEAKNITLEDVKKLTAKYDENNIFKLVDAVIKKDKKTIFKTYKELIDAKNEPSVILILLANQFRLMYSCNVLLDKGLDKYKIGNALKEHPYRVGLAIDNSEDIEKNELLSILKKLAELDIKIKTGEIDRIKGLESFFLEL